MSGEAPKARGRRPLVKTEGDLVEQQRGRVSKGQHLGPGGSNFCSGTFEESYLGALQAMDQAALDILLGVLQGAMDLWGYGLDCGCGCGYGKGHNL